MCVKLNKHFNDALFPSSSSSSFYNANDAISVNYIADIPAGSDNMLTMLNSLRLCLLRAKCMPDLQSSTAVNFWTCTEYLVKNS